MTQREIYQIIERIQPCFFHQIKAEYEKIGGTIGHMRPLTQLNAWGYITYELAKNPLSGGRDRLYRIKAPFPEATIV